MGSAEVLGVGHTLSFLPYILIVSVLVLAMFALSTLPLTTPWGESSWGGTHCFQSSFDSELPSSQARL